MPNPGFIRRGESPKGKLAGILGSALGEGLGEFTGQYLADKSLQSVLDDEELREAPISERMGRLEAALRPHGKRGESILQKRMQIEQQAEQEKVQDVLSRYQAGEELSREEQALIPASYRQKEMELKNKAPAGGLSGQPISPEMGNLINQTLNANKKATAEELGSAFALAGVPPTYSSPYIETRRRQDEANAKPSQMKIEKAIGRDSDVLKKVDEQRDSLAEEEAAIDVMKDSVTKGDQSFWTYNNLAEKTGLELFRDAKGGNFKTASKTFLINTIGKIGARPNQYIEQQIADALAKVGRSEEANLGSIAIIEFGKDMKKKYSEIVDELEEKGDYDPGSLGRTAQKELQQYAVQRQQELSDELSRLSMQEDMKSQKAKGGNKKTFDSLPPPMQFKGKRIQGPSGILISDGTKWVPSK